MEPVLPALVSKGEMVATYEADDMPSGDERRNGINYDGLDGLQKCGMAHRLNVILSILFRVTLR